MKPRLGMTHHRRNLRLKRREFCGWNSAASQVRGGVARMPNPFPFKSRTAWLRAFRLAGRPSFTPPPLGRSQPAFNRRTVNGSGPVYVYVYDPFSVALRQPLAIGV